MDNKKSVKDARYDKHGKSERPATSANESFEFVDSIVLKKRNKMKNTPNTIISINTFNDRGNSEGNKKGPTFKTENSAWTRNSKIVNMLISITKCKGLLIITFDKGILLKRL